MLCQSIAAEASTEETVNSVLAEQYSEIGSWYFLKILFEIEGQLEPYTLHSLMMPMLT